MLSFERMNQPVDIKICGMTREEDVELALSLGANFLGFIVYPQSPRGITLERAVALSCPRACGATCDRRCGDGSR